MLSVHLQVFGKAEGAPLDLKRHLESLGGNVRHLQDGSVTMAHLYPVLEIPPDPSGTPEVSELEGWEETDAICCEALDEAFPHILALVPDVPQGSVCPAGKGTLEVWVAQAASDQHPTDGVFERLVVMDVWGIGVQL